ncbi:MAG: TonB-dependent receptor [Gemmatimonadales bacterium]|jgi:iron complex outermembrane receptor protein
MHGIHTKALLLAALAACMAAAPLAAQQTGAIAGRVTDAGTGAPIGTALVSVVETGLRSTADEQGRFHIGRLAPGSHTLSVTAIGYESAERAVTVAAGERVTVVVTLQVKAIELGGLAVSVLRPDLHPEGRLEQESIQEANPRDPGELLRSVPGVAAVRRGPLGLDPVVRGLRETEVGSYIDGERRFPAGPARMDSPLTHVDPLAFESVQVAKGPYALTWGAGNLAAIRVETQQIPPAREGTHGHLTAGYNTNLDAAETSGSLSGREGDLSWWGFGAFRNGNDYEDGDGNVIPGDFESWEGRGKLGIETGANSRLILGAGYQDQGGPIDYPGRLLNADLFHTLNTSARWKADLSSGAGTLRDVDLHVYYNDVDHNMTNAGKPTAEPNPDRMPPFPLNIAVETSTQVVGARAAGTLGLSEWELELGGDMYSANRNAVRTIKRADLDPQPLLFEDLVWPDVTITDAGVFARADRNFVGDLTLSFAGRVDFVAARADTSSEFFAENVGTDLDQSEVNLSAAATLGIGLSANWTLFVGVGSAVRTADALERYSDRFPASKSQISAEFVGNPELKPERSNQADVWVEGSYGNLSLQLSAFARKMNDYITLRATDLPKRLPLSPDTVFQYVNGDATFWGFDAQAAVGLTDSWTLKLAADYLWGKDDLLDEPAIGVAPPHASLGLRYDLPSRTFYGEASTDFVGKMSADRVAIARGETPTGGYVTGNLRFGWQATDRLLVRFGVENVTDKYYVDHLNAKNPYTGMQIPEAGRVFYGKVSAAF